MPVIIGFPAAAIFIYYQMSVTGVPFVGGFYDTIIFFFVFGGSLMCTLMRNSLIEFLGMFGTLGKFIYYPQPKPLELV